MFFDVAVILVCVLSFILCARSIIRGLMLQHVSTGLACWADQHEPFECNWANIRL